MTSTVTVSESSFALTVVFDKISTLAREVGSSVDSERVMIQHGTSLYVKMYLGGDIMEAKDHCSLYLYSTDAVKLSFSMKLVNHRDDKKSIIHQSINSNEFKAGGGLGWPSFTKTENLLDSKHGFLEQDAITIVLQITIEGKKRLFDSKDYIAQDMSALLFDASTADNYIVIENNDQIMASPSTHLPLKHNLETSMVFNSSEARYQNRIPVHKFILQSRSKVFKTMLSSTMKESTTSEIIISDFDYDVVKEFIRFLYKDTCNVVVLDKHAKPLLAMAHKYEVKMLFQICESFLIDTLNVDNVVDFLKLGDLYGAMDLKGKALKLIKSEFKAVANSGRFYESLNPELMHEMICRLGDA